MSDPVVIIEPSTIDTIVILQENIENQIIVSSNVSSETILPSDNQNEIIGKYIAPDNVTIVCCDNTQGSSGNGTGFVNQAEWLVIEKIAGESISALNLVRFQDADNVIKATNNQTYADAKVTGIALNGASIGGTVRVLIFGIIEDPFFTFPANTLLFLGVDGTITSTPPLSGFSAIIGEAPAVGVVTLSIREPTIL